MKAIVVSKYGNSDVMKVVERAIPEVGDSDVLIRIMASSVSPVDVAFRMGQPLMSRFFTGFSRPKHEIPGDIIAGIVEKKGLKVTKFEIGDRVYGHAGLSFGAQAQYIALNVKEAIVKMPEEMSFETAAAFAYSGMTAKAFLEEYYQITPDTKVLINGASGAIGTFAIQFAKLKGAHVTAVCSERNTELVTSIGADSVIDYAKEDFTVREESFDFIFDVVGKSKFGKCKQVLNPGGIYLSTMPTLGLMLRTALKMKSQNKTGKFVATGLKKPEQKREDLKELAKRFEEKELVAVIDCEYTMDEIIQAHDHVENGHKSGNVILKMS